MKLTELFYIFCFVSFLQLAPVSLAQDAGAKVEEGQKADVEIVISGNDLIQFDKNAFEVTEGQSVKLTIKHIGKLPVAAMGHNIVILKPGTDVAGFATKAITAVKNGYIPQDKDSQAAILVMTRMVGGGESDSVQFTAPAVGKYDYICTFPGHFAIMKGVMTVKGK